MIKLEDLNISFMETKSEKDKQKEVKEQINVLEESLKTAFKNKQMALVEAGIKSLKTLDPENHLADKIVKKSEELKLEEAKKAKEAKSEEYENMLKNLYKAQDFAKLKALAKEFVAFDPENRSAGKWLEKAEKVAPTLNMDGKSAVAVAKVVEPGKEVKEQIKMLEKDLKAVYRGGQLESVMVGIKSLKNLDPENRLADKLTKKVEKLKEKEDRRAKEIKTKDFEEKLKNLYKSQDLAGLKALAAEFSQFDPESRSARGWADKTEKLTVKLNVADKTTKPLQIATAVAPQPAIKPPVLQPAINPQTPQPAPSGNIFTKMFGKKEEEEVQKKSIIDTIVAKSEKKEEKIATGLKETDGEKPAKSKDAASLLVFSKIFLNFTAIFIVLSALFLYVEWIDKENSVLGLVGVADNTGGRLYHAAEKMKTLKEEETTLNKDIELYKGGYDDKVLATVQTIISQRINWPDIFAKINEVTNSVYELNDFFKYIEYDNYSLDAENGTIRVSGSLSDPLGRNLTKLVELEEAFKYYPKDKNNPDDPTQSYFTGFKEFSSFSKSLDAETGRYTSSFQLSFTLNKQ